MSLKENLRKYRLAAGYNQVKDFAENTLHVKYTTYLSYENRGSWPDEETLIKICNVLHVTPNELLDFEFEGNKRKKIIQLCKDCGLQLDFIGGHDGGLVFISKSDTSDPLPPVDFQMPTEDFFELVQQVVTSAQFHAKLRESLITAFSQYELKQLRQLEDLITRDEDLKQIKQLVARIKQDEEKIKKKLSEAGDAATAATKTTTSKQLQNDEN